MARYLQADYPPLMLAQLDAAPLRMLNGFGRGRLIVVDGQVQ
jgi:hypothetical protein